MAMTTPKRENGLLKLVHPGGFVELHREPITAAEVMSKNPRHCVTRPDVFKYPWIVVRPESWLKLGRVFYVVPNHTIHRLLQAHERGPQPSLKHQSSRQHDHRRSLKQKSSHDSEAEETSSDQDHSHHLKQQSQDKPHNLHGCRRSPSKSGATLRPKGQNHALHLERQSAAARKVNHKREDCYQHRKQRGMDNCRIDAASQHPYQDSHLHQRSQFMGYDELILAQQFYHGKVEKQTPFESSLEVIPKNQEDHQQEAINNSPVEGRPAAGEHDHYYNRGGDSIPTARPGDFKQQTGNQVMPLKSCLRKHKHSRSRDLRVRFDLTEHNMEMSERRCNSQ